MRIRFVEVLAVVLAGCASPRVAIPSSAPAAQPIPPPPTAALEREIRYYRDESGALWDDRGRRVAAPP